ncbi:MAG: GGDEF and EAL domain-containing protein [Ruminococcus sp.]|nr:GGDEF and EAL domain-containing protein [Ruminococcus sp.]
MNDANKARLDSYFDALTVLSDGNYVFLCDLESKCSRWSESAVDFFGLPGVYMDNASAAWTERIHPDDLSIFTDSINEIADGIAESHNIQYRVRARNGNYVVCTCKGVIMKNDEGEPEFFGGSIKNHGQLSYTDGVTGLRSMYGFIDDLKITCWKKQKSCVLYIGSNGFSEINDMYGYSFGNAVLRELSSVITEIFGEKCMVYKIDGPKFAIISTELSQEEVEKRYYKLKQMVTQSFYVEGEKIVLTVSGGMVIVDNFSLSTDTIVSCLKYAYHESRERKLGELFLFQNNMNDASRQYIEKINTIRNAVTEGCRGFFLCYQPIIKAENEQLRGMEALLRWKNDEYGVVPPNEFISVLEQDAVFPKLGNWILHQAMVDGKKIIEKYPDFIVNVNISYAQIQHKSFLPTLFEMIEKTGFPAENLCLELTERCRLLDIDLLKSMFTMIKDNGIKIALDDFGTGFSSIGVLRVLNVDTIKVDREYVKDITNSTVDQKTVMCISNLAGAFSADICAEGVETIEMRDILKDYNVGSYQGYYYSKPLVFEDFMQKYVNE